MSLSSLEGVRGLTFNVSISALTLIFIGHSIVQCLLLDVDESVSFMVHAYDIKL